MLALSPTLLNEISAHLARAYPNEGAGLLLGLEESGNRQVQKVLPLENQFAEAEQFHRFLITAEDMLAGEEAALAEGLDVVGIFHSHPDSANIPSEYDREYALPWYSYLIVRVDNGQAVSFRSWLLQAERAAFDEEPVTFSS